MELLVAAAAAQLVVRAAAVRREHLLAVLARSAVLVGQAYAPVIELAVADDEAASNLRTDGLKVTLQDHHAEPQLDGGEYQVELGCGLRRAAGGRSSTRWSGFGVSDWSIAQRTPESSKSDDVVFWAIGPSCLAIW